MHKAIAAAVYIFSIVYLKFVSGWCKNKDDDDDDCG